MERRRSAEYPFFASGQSFSTEDTSEDELELPGLSRSSSPAYDRHEKLRQANQELRKDSARSALKRNSKVRFSDNVNYEDETNYQIFEHTNDALQTTGKSFEGKSNPTKVLLVTVPTGICREQSEEFGSDFSDSEEQETTTQSGPQNAFRGRAEELQPESTGEIHPEEEGQPIEEDWSWRQDDTPDTSTDNTVVFCRSETEESDLTEWFSRSVQLEDPLEESPGNEGHSADSPVFDFEPSEEKQEDVLEPREGELDSPKVQIVRREDQLELRQSHLNLRKIQLEQREKQEEKQIGERQFGKRPSTAISVQVRRKVADDIRPATAPPPRRPCCSKVPTSRLPSYNGLRSEYGLSAEQLQQRESRKKEELANALRLEKEERYEEQKRKWKENQVTFNSWLTRKKREAEVRAMRRRRQGAYCWRVTPAPTAHLLDDGLD